jgi:excisionase family DNA binding protein
MDSMRDILDRALAWRSSPDGPATTDEVKIGLAHMTPGVRPEDILTPEEVAARLKVPESWVYEKTRARCRKPIPCLRLGRYVRFDWQAVVTWLQEGAASEVPHAKRAGISNRR